MAKNIRWGIIGLGNIANKFAQAITKMNNCELLAVSSRDKTKSIEFGKKYSISEEYCFDSYEKLYRNKDIDAIYIAVPNVFHKDLSILCLKNKKAVLCEKPIALNSFEAKEIIDTAKENNTFFMEAMKTRFLPVHRKVLEVVKNKEIGEIKLLQGDFGFQSIFDYENRLYNKALGGGSLLDVGIYCVSYASFILGNNISKVFARGDLAKTGVDECVTMNLSYKNGGEAQLYSSIVLNTKRDMVITGTKGYMVIPRFSNGEKLFLKTEEYEKNYDFSFDINGFEYEIEEVNESIRNSKVESEIMSWEDSLEVMKIIDIIKEKIW